MKQYKLDSIIGPIFLVASESGLHGIFWKPIAAPFVQSLAESEVLGRTVQQLTEYFAGKRRDFDLPLDVQGTAFQKSVWQELSKIPYGQTCSYSDIANRIRNSKAVRAVGSANGRNAFSIVVPCHRVIAADGSLGGYAGGLDIKTRLLQLESQRYS